MTIQIVPLQPVASQEISATLGDQPCQIKVAQKSTGMFMDLYVNNVLIIGGVLCHNLCKIVRSVYLGFDGDLAFVDLQGSDDPVYTGIGERFLLCYLPAADLP